MFSEPFFHGHCFFISTLYLFNELWSHRNYLRKIHDGIRSCCHHHPRLIQPKPWENTQFSHLFSGLNTKHGNVLNKQQFKHCPVFASELEFIWTLMPKPTSRSLLLTFRYVLDNHYLEVHWMKYFNESLVFSSSMKKSRLRISWDGQGWRGGSFFVSLLWICHFVFVVQSQSHIGVIFSIYKSIYTIFVI